MKNPLGRSELIGLLLLAIIVVGISLCAIFTRGCSAESSVQQDPQFMVTVLDTLPAPVNTESAAGKSPKKAEKATKKKSSKSAKSRKKKSSESSPAFRRTDPFSDTIPH